VTEINVEYKRRRRKDYKEGNVNNDKGCRRKVKGD
jgi:hypothetical protein